MTELVKGKSYPSRPLKEGDRVVDEDTGDVGVILRKVGPEEDVDHYGEAWWVRWETGDFAGEELWSYTTALRLEGAVSSNSAEQTLNILRPLLDEVARRGEKMGGDGSSFTVTIDAEMWEQIKDYV